MLIKGHHSVAKIKTYGTNCRFFMYLLVLRYLWYCNERENCFPVSEKSSMKNCGISHRVIVLVLNRDVADFCVFDDFYEPR